MNKAIPRGATRINQRLKQFPRRHLLLASTIAASVMGLMALLPSGDVEARRNEIPMSIDAFQPQEANTELTSSPTIPESSQFVSNQNADQSETAIKEVEQEAEAKALAKAAYDLEQKLGKWHSVTIKSGDNLSVLFNSQGLNASVVYQVANTPKYGETLASIRPGESLEFRINQEGTLTQLRYVKSRLESIFFNREDDGYRAEQVTLSPEIHPTYASGIIESSLFLASQKAGLSQNLTMELAGIFGWDIDFVQDIRSGDNFNLLYEEKYLEGEKLGDGNILVASFTNQGETYTAIRYTDSNGDTNYYTPDGKSMKKAFLRTPVDFTRISSRFNPNRLHPVFKTKRPHRGVDYAAPMNTPIKAAGDGRVQFSGWQNGFGNVVFIQHPNNVVTVYAHANKLAGLKKGQRVRQGQTIAYVGKTGWATGPHLHYEFRVNGVHRNPMTVKLPDAAPIAKNEMANFRKKSELMIARLEKHRETLLATQ
ncbi:peptidoglycan DD-metalloendopeptidase family protein [Thalassotalea sp. G20_0]|uniref:OapA family protein n=1 Tax=Thalassotalea sp. G20_0 TaxID=2821093 RepID=UPI001AD96A10|nr:peptidoglycan DD-metalloendopeptidase family protein [Thalassotalea sp. G20_0]MBO9492795.1 peptidoglycan DD-metalloendopeptidase family protein [Thalassotalea sp. G20_0]